MIEKLLYLCTLYLEQRNNMNEEERNIILNLFRLFLMRNK